MILLSIALLFGQQISADAEQAEIVVIGQRLARWSATYMIRGSKLRCAAKTSTGDPDIDSLGCKAFETCADQLAPRIAKSDEKSLANSDRLAMKAGIKQDLSACVADQRTVLIAELAKNRQNSPR